MRRNRWMTSCSVLLMLCILVGGLLPLGVTAANASEKNSGSIMTKAAPMMAFGEAAGVSVEVEGSVELINGTAVEWIDRVALPDSIRALYDTFVEGSDNDGVKDVLIEDEYYLDSEFMITVATETIPLNGKEGAEVAQEVKAKYLPYLYAVFAAFDRDHPEVFWLSHEWQLGGSYVTEGNQCSVSVQIGIGKIRANPYLSEAAIKAAIERRDAAVARICEDFTWQTTRYERIRHFNSVLTKTNQYNTMSNLNNVPHDARECISALSGTTGLNGPICEGYARAFKVLCDANDIPCVLVDGVASSQPGRSEAHMWNYVQMGNEKWYAVDVTWNDPSVQNATGAVSGAESEAWLLVGGNTVFGDSIFSDTHTVRNQAYEDTTEITATKFVNGPTLQWDAYNSDLNIALNIPEGGYVYDGTEQMPLLKVKSDGIVLNLNTDYTVHYSNHKNAGVATVTVTGKGLYSQMVGIETFVIHPREVHPTVTVEDKVYDGTDVATVHASFSPTELLAGDESVRLHAEGAFVTAFARKEVEVQVKLTLSGEGSSNYTVQNPTEIYAEIQRRPVTVYADALTTSTENFDGLTYTIDPDTPLVKGESLKGKLDFEETDTEGVYDIVQGTLTDKNNLNYIITFVSAKLTITSEQSNDKGASAPLGLESIDELTSLLQKEWFLYAAIGVGAAVVAVVAIGIVVSCKRRRGE